MSACYLHPNAYIGETECYWGSPSNVLVQSEWDIALLELSAPITSVPPRPIGPPRSCLSGGHTTPIVVRGVSGASTEYGPRKRSIADGHVVGGMLLGPFLTEGGDSGGPYTEERYDDELGPVLAVTSKRGYNPFLWSDANQDWIWSVIDPAGDCAFGATGPCQPLGFDAPLPDEDADGLPDMRDLCPTEELLPGQDCDGQHCDDDGDWLGNECDAWPGICDHDDTDEDGIPDEVDPCPVHPVHAADGDGDGVPNACDRCPGFDDSGFDPAIDTDGDGVPDGCDNCPGLSNAGQQNCNLDLELARVQPIEGDACDADPCPRVDASTWFPATGSVDYATSNAGMSGYALGVGAAVEGTMRTGFRWCPCTAADDDSVEARQDCLSPFAGACVRDAAEYTTAGSRWRVMSHGFTDAEGHPGPVPGPLVGTTDTEWIFPYRPPPERDDTPGRDFEEDYLSGVWDFETDGTLAGVLESFTSGPLSFSRVRGVVWGHARNHELPVAGAPGPDAFGCNVSMSCAAYDLELSSHYYSGAIEEERGLMPSGYAKVEELIGWALLGPRVCPQCVRALPLPMLTTACAFPGMICLRYGDGSSGPLIDRPVWENIDPRVLEAWKDEPQLRWLMASEPAETLLPGAIRFAAYDPATRRIDLMGVLTDAGVTTIDRGARLLQDTHFGAFELLSGNTATVLGVGGYLNQQPSAIVRRLDLATGQREDLPIGIALGNVRTAALDPSGRWLLAMDEAPGGGRRLVRVDLSTGAATTLLTGKSSKPDRHALAAMPGGNWVLVGSTADWDQHALTVFNVSPGGTVTELRSWVGDGTLASAHAASNGRGVSFVLADQLGWRPSGIANEEMQSVVAVEDLF